MARRRARQGFTPETALAWLPVITRLGGLFIAIWAALFHDFDRPSLYLLAASMMAGEPLVRWWLRSRNGNGS